MKKSKKIKKLKQELKETKAKLKEVTTQRTIGFYGYK